MGNHTQHSLTFISNLQCDHTCLNKRYHWYDVRYRYSAPRCGWDGGDCCDEASEFAYCATCACTDPAELPDGECSGSCGNYPYFGDGFCDDENNALSLIHI